MRKKKLKNTKVSNKLSKNFMNKD